MLKKTINTLIITCIVCLSAFSQEAIYNELINRKVETDEIIKKVFSLKSITNLSAVSLQINGYSQINDNILPVITIKTNNKILFSGILSDYTFGKNNKYGIIEFNITDFVKSGNNNFSIEYEGLSANSYIFVKNINIVIKRKGNFYKNLSDFNYDKSLYSDYLKKTLTIGSTVIATENYQKVTAEMQGEYYGEATFNSKFCCIKWSKNLGSKVKCPDGYPSKYKAHAFYVPYANIKIYKTKSADDKKPPKINSAVSNYVQVHSKTLNVSGRVTDQSGIYAVFINNIKANIDAQGYYNLNLKLKIGTNTVKINAIDDYGNYSSKIITVIRNMPTDDLPPKINITFPQQKQFSVFTNSVEFRGEIIDDNNVDYLQVICNKNVYKIYIGADKQFAININLLKGKNEIRLNAFDETGNSSQPAEYIVDFSPEEAKPKITLLNPHGLSETHILYIDKEIKELPITVMVNSKIPINDVSITYVNTPVTIPLDNTQKINYFGSVRLPMSQIINMKITATDMNNTSCDFTFVLKRRENKDEFPDIDKDIPITGKKNPNCYALIIGNADYDQEKSLFNDLDYVANDAEIFKQYLIKTYGVPSLNIEFANNVGTMDFLALINSFTKKIENHPDAQFLFYYSGHGGIYENQSSYFLPIDYNESTDVYNIIDNLIVETVIYNILLAAPSKLTVILDMCYSGKGGKGVEVGNTDFDFDGPVVLFSASETEAYPFERRNHSLFTYALLKNIHDTKGDITYKELSVNIQTTINQIIEKEKLKHDQKMKVVPSTILDEEWENWKLP